MILIANNKLFHFASSGDVLNLKGIFGHRSKVGWMIDDVISKQISFFDVIEEIGVSRLREAEVKDPLDKVDLWHSQARTGMILVVLDELDHFGNLQVIHVSQGHRGNVLTERLLQTDTYGGHIDHDRFIRGYITAYLLLNNKNITEVDTPELINLVKTMSYQMQQRLSGIGLVQYYVEFLDGEMVRTDIDTSDYVSAVTLQPDPYTVPELRTSEDWLKTMPGVSITDPDGWDRTNYDYSFKEEMITLDEFNLRLAQSTIIKIEK